MNFAPLMTHEQELTAEQYMLCCAARCYLEDTFIGRMPVGQGGWFQNRSPHFDWSYTKYGWPVNAARELYKRELLTTGHPDDYNVTPARYVRINLCKCAYDFVEGELLFRVGSAVFSTDYERRDANEMLAVLEENGYDLNEFVEPIQI